MKLNDIGLCILECRLARKMKLDDLARKTSLSSKYIDMVEKGLLVPTIERLKRLSNVLGFDTADFIEFLQGHKSEHEEKDSLEGQAPGNSENILSPVFQPDQAKKENMPEVRPDPFSSHPLPPSPPLPAQPFNKASEERRKTPRFSSDFYTECEIESEKIFITVVDISNGGLRIMLSKQYGKGTRIHLNINTFDDLISFTSRIVWIKEIGEGSGGFVAGLEIIEITDKDRSKYEKVVAGKLQVVEA